MSLSITGKIHVIKDVQQVSASFKKREFVVEYATNPMYPQYVQFQLVQDKVEMLEAYNVGDTVKVEFDIRGREWESPQGEVKYFNSLDAWRMTLESAGAGEAEKKTSNPAAPQPVASQQEPEDLPF